MALMYIINKPQIFSKLDKWLLLFLKYDFKIIYKPGRPHLITNTLNRLPNQIEPIGIPNQICDVHMFTLQLEWLHNVYEYLFEGVMLVKFTTSQRQYLTQRAEPFMLQEGIYTNMDKIIGFCQILQLEHVPTVLQKLHVEELQEGISLLTSL